MKFLLLLGMTFFCASASMLVVRSFHWAMGMFYILNLGSSVLLYLVNCQLIAKYIKKNSPAEMDTSEASLGVQMWELTAGWGIVPRWVSLIGLLACGFFLAIPFELFARLLRWAF